ncbi:MAG: acyltransferase family protein [Streptosporangiales bacterium]|nr:acyltransferase family protein [Streptosporangiales bacterium]
MAEDVLPRSAPPPAATHRTVAPAASTRPVVANGADRAPRTARDPLLDNAKFLAIALVVIGHAIELTIGDMRTGDGAVPLARAAYVTIYSFHMPVFVLVAGYLSRDFGTRPGHAQRVISAIVVPYLVFEVTYELFNHYLANGSASIDILDPSYAMWFLIALFVWRLSAPLWRVMTPVAAIAAAVTISLLSGVLELPPVLDLYRILGFLPFFVVGLVIPAERFFTLVRHRITRILAAPALAGMFAFAYVVLPHYPTQWLYYTDGYHAIGTTDLLGIAGRALVLAGGFVMVTAFLALVPRRRTWITALGAASLYVYLLHRFVVKAAEYNGLYDIAWIQTPLGVLALVGGALVLTLILASPPVRALFRPVVEPRLEWLFRSQR